MPYDEETRELNDQFHRRGDYSRDNPDLAVENRGVGRPLTSDEQAGMLMRVCIKLQEQNKNLLTLLERMVRAYEAETGDTDCTCKQDWCCQCMSWAAIKAAKE